MDEVWTGIVECLGLRLDSQQWDSILDPGTAEYCEGVRGLNAGMDALGVATLCQRIATACPPLRVLSATSAAALSSEALLALCDACSQLEELVLPDAALLTDEALAAFVARCPRLRIFRMPGLSRAGHQTLSAIATYCPNVFWLQIEGSLGVSDVGVDRVVRACRDLCFLRLSDSRHLSNAAVLAISEHCRNLLIADVSGCDRITTMIPLERLATPRGTLLRLEARRCAGLRVTQQVLAITDAELLLNELRRSSSGTELPELKLVLLGDPGRGKSELARRLAGRPPLCRHQITRDFEISSVLFDCDPLPVQARLFDFGGQESLHASHRLFLTADRCIFVVVVDGSCEDEADCLRYWIAYLDENAPFAPVVVVVTHGDKERRIRGDLKELLSTPHRPHAALVDNYSNMCTDDSDAEKVRTAIRSLIKSPVMQRALRAKFSSDFFIVRDWVAGRGPRDFAPRFVKHIDNAEFVRVCGLLGIDGVGAKARIDVYRETLIDLGYLQFVGRDERVKRANKNSVAQRIFHPEWIKGPVYLFVHELQLQGQNCVIGTYEAREELVRSHSERVGTHWGGASLLDEDIHLSFAFLEAFGLLIADESIDSYCVPDQLAVAREPLHSSELSDEAYEVELPFLADALLVQLFGRWYHSAAQGVYQYRNRLTLRSKTGDAIAIVKSLGRFKTLRIDVTGRDELQRTRLVAQIERDLSSIVDLAAMRTSAERLQPSISWKKISVRESGSIGGRRSTRQSLAIPELWERIPMDFQKTARAILLTVEELNLKEAQSDDNTIARSLSRNRAYQERHRSRTAINQVINQHLRPRLLIPKVARGGYEFTKEGIVVVNWLRDNVQV